MGGHNKLSRCEDSNIRNETSRDDKEVNGKLFEDPRLTRFCFAANGSPCQEIKYYFFRIVYKISIKFLEKVKN
jgi:hypothetical protein